MNTADYYTLGELIKRNGFIGVIVGIRTLAFMEFRRTKCKRTEYICDELDSVVRNANNVNSVE